MSTRLLHAPVTAFKKGLFTKLAGVPPHTCMSMGMGQQQFPPHMDIEALQVRSLLAQHKASLPVYVPRAHTEIQRPH